MCLREFPGGPVVRSHTLAAKIWVQFLLRELRSQRSHKQLVAAPPPQMHLIPLTYRISKLGPAYLNRAQIISISL